MTKILAANGSFLISVKGTAVLTEEIRFCLFSAAYQIGDQYYVVTPLCPIAFFNTLSANYGNLHILKYHGKTPMTEISDTRVFN